VNGLILADELLEQAVHLVRRERRHPRQASLRRAVSTAYYALFHLLISEAILNWKHTKHRPGIARQFQHAQMRIASESIANKLTAGIPRLKSGSREHDVVQSLLAVAANFVDLYKARQTADYDLSSSIEETYALHHVYLSVDAFKNWKSIRDEQAAQDYLLALLFKDR